MIQEFNDCPWHDAELKEIVVDRVQSDTVKILIRWPEDHGGHSVFIEFLNCYAFQADMHFGFIPPDFILEAECIQHSQQLDNIKKKWAKMGLNISGLNCYKIITNSTNSTIDIFALDFRILDIP